MTTHQDWLFRASYLRMQAVHKRKQALALEREAEDLDHRANSAHHIAEKTLGEPIDVIS
jgi:hypothetical protein